MKGPVLSVLWKNYVSVSSRFFQKFLGSSFLMMNFRIDHNFPSPPLDLKVNVGRIEIYIHHTKWEGDGGIMIYITASPIPADVQTWCPNTSILRSIFCCCFYFFKWVFFWLGKYFVSVLNVENTMSTKTTEVTIVQPLTDTCCFHHGQFSVHVCSFWVWGLMSVMGFLIEWNWTEQSSRIGLLSPD